MTIDFAKLKANSGKRSIETISAEMTKMNQKYDNGPDERFWIPTVDKAGNGYAIIRFLAAPPGENVPFVRIYDHGFQGPTGKWYIEKSLTTFEGEKDPLSELNSKLWNTNLESNKEIARKQKRRLHFYSNILVVDDPAKPDNNGKVFLFKYGKKIFDKLSETTQPQFADEEAFNAFDLWEGANFKLKVRNHEGYRNYDKSEFMKPSQIAKTDEEIETIWRTCYSLQDLLNRKHFKTYQELKLKLATVLEDGTDDPWKGENETKSAAREAIEHSSSKSRKTEEARDDEKVESPSLQTDDSGEDDGETLEYFKSLANKI
jgi:hypothetical protein